MLNKKKISEIAKKIVRTQKGLQDPQIMHPEREWLIGIVLAIVLLSLCVFWSIFTYTRHMSTTADKGPTDEVAPSVYRESLVKNAIEQFSEREQRFLDLVGTAPVPLPSEPIVDEGASSSISEEVSETLENVTVDDEVMEDLPSETRPSDVSE